MSKKASLLSLLLILLLAQVALTAEAYQGRLTLFVVEPTSRWNDGIGVPYNFGFLDYAFDQDIAIPANSFYNQNLTWKPADAGYPDVTENNIMIIAVLFNSESDTGYAYPPANNPFLAHNVDAAAGATPGDVDSNRVGTFTHTVFLEEGSSTGWGTCPVTRAVLHDIHDSGDYNFYYLALLEDVNSKANARLQENYNLAATPTCFYDGGGEVTFGGSADENVYRTAIENSGAKPVFGISRFILTVNWEAKGALEINIDILNGELVTYTCGDADASGAVDISDAVYLISYIFGGGPAPDPIEAGDPDCSGAIDISDAVYVISYIFGGGPAPCASCS